jgi:hypothetical protein
MCIVSNAYNLVYLYSESWLAMMGSGRPGVVERVFMVVSLTCLLVSLVLELLLELLLLELSLKLFFVVDFLEATKSSFGGTAAFALHEVDPDEISALGLADLF